MLNTLKALNRCSSVSGREKTVSDKILTYIAPLTDKVWEDAMGNLIALKKGNGEDKKKMDADQIMHLFNEISVECGN